MKYDRCDRMTPASGIWNYADVPYQSRHDGNTVSGGLLMNSLERVSLILQHKEADRVPVYPLINSISRKYTGIDYAKWSLDAELCAESIIKATQDIDVDVVCSLVDLSVEAADFGQKILYPAHEAAHPVLNERFIKSEDDYVKIEPINPRKTPRMSEHIKLCGLLTKSLAATKPVVAFVFGPLGVLSMLRGQEDMFMDCIECPEEIHKAEDAITQTLIEYVTALIDTGVHAVMLDTLYASQSIMSKSMWKEMEAPYVKRLAEHIRKKGAMVMIHNCGNGIYFDAQIEAMRPDAISFLYPPDDCEDFAQTKEKYGDKTTLIGCVTPSWLIDATEEQIVEESRRQMELFKKDGGFILATGCEYPSILEPDKAKIIVEAAKKYGIY